VIIRGNAGQTIFFCDDDWHHLYLLLQEGIARYGYRVHAFCCMSNHIHFVIQIGKVPLSKVMQNIAFRYTRWINRRAGRMGHLFQGRYKALLVDADSYLLELTRYIHLNPVRAGMVRDPAEYRWSSHRAYLGTETIPWLTTDWVLSQFGMQLSVSRRGYKEFVSEGVGEGHREDFYQGREDPRVLGDDQFVEDVLGRSAEKSASRPSLDKLVKTVCEAYGVTDRQLCDLSRNRKAAEVRSVIGHLAMQTECAALTEVARRFGRDVATLSKGVRRLAEQAEVSKEVRERIVRLLEQ